MWEHEDQTKIRTRNLSNRNYLSHITLEPLPAMLQASIYRLKVPAKLVHSLRQQNKPQSRSGSSSQPAPTFINLPQWPPCITHKNAEGETHKYAWNHAILAFINLPQRPPCITIRSRINNLGSFWRNRAKDSNKLIKFLLDKDGRFLSSPKLGSS